MGEDGTSARESTGGRRLLICLSEARELLVQACRGGAEMVDLRTSDGRPAFVVSLGEADARRFMADPRAAALVLRRE